MVFLLLVPLMLHYIAAMYWGFSRPVTTYSDMYHFSSITISNLFFHIQIPTKVFPYSACDLCNSHSQSFVPLMTVSCIFHVLLTSPHYHKFFAWARQIKLISKVIFSTRFLFTFSNFVSIMLTSVCHLSCYFM